MPMAGLTALQALRDVGRISPGQKVLIVGAGGGVGMFAVQIATSFGARAAGGCHRKAQGYSSGMKTVSPIPEDLFNDGPRLARALKESRSRLYGDAVRECVARHSADRVTEMLDRVCADVAPGDGGFAAAAARLTLERSDW